MSGAERAGAGRNHAPALAVRRIDTSNPPGDTRKAADFPDVHPREGRDPGHALRVGAGQSHRLRPAEGDRVTGRRQGDSPAASHGRGAGRSHAVEDRPVHADDSERRAVGPWLDGHEGPRGGAAGRVPDAEAPERAENTRCHPAGGARRGSRRRARREMDDCEPLRRARSRVRHRRGRVRQLRSVRAEQDGVRHLGRREEDRVAEAARRRRRRPRQPADRHQPERPPGQGAGAAAGPGADQGRPLHQRRPSKVGRYDRHARSEGRSLLRPPCST